MSIRIMTKAWDLDLPASQKLVLLSLADQSNDDGVCWPSVGHTTRRTGLCERAIRNAITDMEKAGHLTRNMRPGRSTYYTIHPLDTPASAAPLHLVPHASGADTPASAAPTPASGAPIIVNKHQEPKQSINQISTTVMRTGQVVIHRFSMFEDWDPTDTFGSRLLMAGITEPWLPFLGEFCTHWQGKPTTQETQAGWENKFLKNIKYQTANREARLA